MEERLQKLLAQAGLCSRREAERWIDDGRVTVNGKKASVGDKADPRRDKIFVDGKPIGGAEEKVYLMLYKPRGYVTTMKDEHGRKTVADLVRGCGARVVPVGRLDYNSEGLLLLTNDGDLLNALTHPRHEVEKHYEVRVRGNLENIPKLAEPMEIDGYSIRPATVVTIDRDEISAKLRLTIHEGRNRQIRKMCEKCGLEVRRLKRVAMGTMPLDPHLKSGAWRELTERGDRRICRTSLPTCRRTSDLLRKSLPFCNLHPYALAFFCRFTYNSIVQMQECMQRMQCRREYNE